MVDSDGGWLRDRSGSRMQRCTAAKAHRVRSIGRRRIKRRMLSPRGRVPITVSGCLQLTGNRDFILTRVNEPNESVGFGGTKPSGSAGAATGVVERE